MMKTVVSVACLSVVALSACGEKKDAFTEVLEATGKWTMSAEEKPKYAKMKTNDARTAFVRDRFAAESASLASDADRKMLAAAIYVNFAMLQNRAIPTYCKRMNIDLSEFQREFDGVNKREVAGLAAFLQSRGTDFDTVYGGYAKRLHSTAKYELMSSGSSYSACKTVSEKPKKFAQLTKFSNFYPKVASTLRR